MKTRTTVVGLSALTLTLGLGLCYGLYRHFSSETEVPFSPSLERGRVVPAEDYRLSGPYAHDNLTAFLIHGPSTLPNGSYLTLQEALEQGKAVVHETGNVGELSIENLSSDQEVYVQSGDIVKGGQQDRTFPNDFIVPPRSGRLPIASFCVEQGRWEQRGKEPKFSFSSSSYALSSNQLKLAAKSPSEHRAQSEVWRNVAATQERLSKKLGSPVASGESSSSLQLSMENPKLREPLAPYLRQLSTAPEGKTDVIGVAFAINGKVMSADVYASGALFRKLWPKLLKGSAVEAFAERGTDSPSLAVGVDEVKSFLSRPETAAPSNEAVTERVYMLVREANGQVLFESCDRAQANLVIHRSYLAR